MFRLLHKCEPDKLFVRERLWSIFKQIHLHCVEQRSVINVAEIGSEMNIRAEYLTSAVLIINGKPKEGQNVPVSSRQCALAMCDDSHLHCSG
jgi:hypothetical protein